MDLKKLQEALKKLKLYEGEIDGDSGPLTTKAINALLESEQVSGWKSWSPSRRELAAKQVIVRQKGIDVGEIDGLWGPQTEHAFSTYAGEKVNREDVEKQNADADVVKPPPRPKQFWPRQRDVPKFYGSMGKNQVRIPVRWPMVLAWDTDTAVKTIMLHEKVADSAGRVLDKIAESYTPQQLVEMGVHLFGGSLNVRKMRGGTNWSMHSWGIAIDFDPFRNQLQWGRDRARLAKPDAVMFWEAWEAEGWVSLGRRKNYDWMHVQAAEL